MFVKIYEEKYMRYPQGKSKALTFSYDDGVFADVRLIKLLDKYGLKGTFNLNSVLFDAQSWNGRMDEEQTFNVFSSSRHEIGLHGARHVFLTKVPLPEAVNEVVQNRVYLENKFKRIVRGMAYAYGAYNDEIESVLKSSGVVYARTTQSTHSFALPENWLELNPTCHHGDKEIDELADQFLSADPNAEYKFREPLLFYVWGHSYEFDNNNDWDRMESLCAKLSKGKDIWFATNGEIYDYVQAYKSLVYSMDGERVYNPSCTDVFMDIRGKIYKIPAGEEIVFDK